MLIGSVVTVISTRKWSAVQLDCDRENWCLYRPRDPGLVQAFFYSSRLQPTAHGMDAAPAGRVQFLPISANR